MTVSNGKAAADAVASPRPISDLIALRSDYEDVSVDSLGGETLRVYALSGTARARLVPEMAVLATRPDAEDADTVRAVFVFQTRVVAASLGYQPDEWDDLGSLGNGAIEQMYAVAARLSGMDPEAKAEAVQRLPRRRSTASGTA